MKNKERDTEDLREIYRDYRYSEYNDSEDDRYDTRVYNYNYQNENLQNTNRQRTFFAKKDKKANEYDYYKPKRKRGCCLSFSCGCIVGFFLLIVFIFFILLIFFNGFFPLLGILANSPGLFN